MVEFFGIALKTKVLVLAIRDLVTCPQLGVRSPRRRTTHVNSLP